MGVTPRASHRQPQPNCRSRFHPVERIFGLIFLGTPHNGADRDKWRHVLRGMNRIAKYHWPFEDGESQLVDALDTQSETLQNINIAFANIMNRFRIFFFYEGVKTQIDGISDFVSAPQVLKWSKYLADPQVLDRRPDVCCSYPWWNRTCVYWRDSSGDV